MSETDNISKTGIFFMFIINKGIEAHVTTENKAAKIGLFIFNLFKAIMDPPMS